LCRRTGWQGGASARALDRRHGLQDRPVRGWRARR
jgi:hypothetical protein